MKKEDLYKDYKGYYRFKDSDKLVHRWVAYKHIYLKVEEIGVLKMTKKGLRVSKTLLNMVSLQNEKKLYCHFSNDFISINHVPCL